MSFSIAGPDADGWITRPHEPGEPARHVLELSEDGGHEHARANYWRYEPGAAGKRHVHAEQEEHFVVLHGTLSLYLGEPPERHDVAAGGSARVGAGTPLQSVNHGDSELLVYAHGWPGDAGADVLESAATVE